MKTVILTIGLILIGWILIQIRNTEQWSNSEGNMLVKCDKLAAVQSCSLKGENCIVTGSDRALAVALSWQIWYEDINYKSETGHHLKPTTCNWIQGEEWLWPAEVPP